MAAISSPVRMKPHILDRLGEVYYNIEDHL